MYPELAINLSGQQLTVRSYGFFMFLAAAAVLLLSFYFIKKFRLPVRRTLLCLTVTALAVPVGARILHILTNPAYYALHPESKAALNTAGFALMGGLLLAALVGLAAARILSLPFWRLADAVAPGLGTGLALMRVGCFLNGCCFGLPTRLSWGVRYPYGSPAQRYYMALSCQEGGGLSLGRLVASPLLHPTQLYEMLAAITAAVLAFYLIKKGAKSGLPFLSAALLFTVARLGNHFLRVQPATNDAPVWFYPIIYITLMIFFIAGLIYKVRSSNMEQDSEL